MSEAAAWSMHGEEAPIFSEYLTLCEAANFAPLIDTTEKTVGPEDALIIVDMQNDFIPKDEVNEHGRLAAPEGNNCAGLIVQMAELFAERGGMIVATRDHHPVDHCSFISRGGPCLPHCIQGNGGGHFYKPIGDCLAGLMKAKKRVEIVFKGFHEDVESFGSLPYPEVPPSDRGAEFTLGEEPQCYGCSSIQAWTGSFKLKCSNLDFTLGKFFEAEAENNTPEEKIDVNALPDILAVYNRETLGDRLRKEGIQRVFVCGLVFDLCIADTAINSKKDGFKAAYIVMDATRPIHLPGLGQYGTGFLNPVDKLQERFLQNGVQVIPTRSVIHGLQVRNPLGPASPKAAKCPTFPSILGPWKLVHVGSNAGTLRYSPLSQSWTFDESRVPLFVKSAQNIKLVPEPCGPKHPVTAAERQHGEVPAAAVAFVWANPLSAISMDRNARAWFPTKGPFAAFCFYGGFLFLDANNLVLAAFTLNVGTDISFGAPEEWRGEYSAALGKRWSPVTIPFLQEKGVKLFSWLGPGEVLNGASGPWSPPVPQGGFVYLFHDDLATPDERDIFFPLKSWQGP